MVADAYWMIVKISLHLAPALTHIYNASSRSSSIGFCIWGLMPLPHPTRASVHEEHMHTPFSLLVFGPIAGIMCGKHSDFPVWCIFQCAMCCQCLHSVLMRSGLCCLSACSAPTWFLFTLSALQTYAQGVELADKNWKHFIFSNVRERQFHVLQRYFWLQCQ